MYHLRHNFDFKNGCGKQIDIDIVNKHIRIYNLVPLHDSPQKRNETINNPTLKFVKCGINRIINL